MKVTKKTRLLANHLFFDPKTGVLIKTVVPEDPERGLSFNEPMVFKGENLRIAVANLGGIDYVEWECDGVRQIASIDTVDGSRSLLVYCYGTGLVAPGLHKVSIIVNTDDTDGSPSKSGSFDLQLLMRG